MTEVVTLGECLIAFVATTPGPLAEVTAFERVVAGAEANVAVGLARLGHRVPFVGRVGADGFGETIARRLRGEAVDIAGLTVDPEAPTGHMFRERRMGNACGAAAASALGDQTGLPDWAELAAILLATGDTRAPDHIR